jgi:YVTN family beta-propeller protein
MKTEDQRKRPFGRKPSHLLWFVPLFLAGLILVSVLIKGPVNAGQPQMVAIIDGTPSYLPIIGKNPVPTATATPVLPVPQFVKNVPLPNAQCPNAVAFNPTSRYVYVANNFSNNVSVLQDTNFVTNILTGEWPTLFAVDPHSALTYVTVLHDRVTALLNTGVVGKIPDHYEPYGVAVNPVNGYTYVTDLDSLVQVIDGTTLIADVPVIDPETGNGAGWLQPVVVDPITGLVYVASWSHGKMYVLDGTEVEANYRAGWGVKDMAIDPVRGYIYMAHESPNQTYPHNISVFNIQAQRITPISTAPKSRAVAVDPLSGYAYVSNESSNSVTILLGTRVIATLPAGDTPWGIGVNPNTGYAFVTNRNSHDVTVYKNAARITTIAVQGISPLAVGVDTTTNDVYIANHGREDYSGPQFTPDCFDASVTILR